MSAIWAAVVLWSSEGIRTSGSPPVDIESVPPELPLVVDSVPTHPQSKTAQRILVYLTAAMSNPRPESAERAPALRRERRLQSTPSHRRSRTEHPIDAIPFEGCS